MYVGIEFFFAHWANGRAKKGKKNLKNHNNCPPLGLVRARETVF